MALSLSLSVVERNDSKLVTFTDTSTGWGSPSYTDIAAVSSQTYSAIMNITITTPTETIVCDTIDLYTLAGPFSAQSDMVYELDYSSLLVNGSSIVTSSEVLPDGIWSVTYKVQYYTGGAWTDIATTSFYVLMYGDIRTRIYNRLRLIYKMVDNPRYNTRDVQEPLLYYSFLKCIEKSAFVARQEELLSMLETLQRLLLNGSNYPW